MGINVLLIKNKKSYPLEEIIGLTSFNLKETLFLDEFLILDKIIDKLKMKKSEYDVIILENEFDSDPEGNILQKNSKILEKYPIVILTHSKNEEKAKKLTEHYILVEQLTVPLLEKSIKLAIEKNKFARLNKKLENYQNLVRESRDAFSRDISQIKEKEKKFFNEYHTTKSELKWLEILLNAVPCGIIILDSRDSHEFLVNEELLKIIGNDSFEVIKPGNLVKIKDLDNFNLYTPEGEKIDYDNFPFIKSIVNGEDIKDMELVVKKDLLEDTVVIINSSPVYNKSGDIIASITAISDISQLKKTELDLINTIKAKNIISQEFNDRVLNILQTITSLLYVEEELDRPEYYNEFYLNENKVRLSLIRSIHEKLSRYDDVKYVDFNKYVRGICSELFHIYNRSIDLDIEGYAPITLDMLLPCGLIVNDIISYRLRSFKSNKKVNISIRLNSKKGRITIKIVDDGPPPKIPIGIENKTDKRLKLTHVLLEQLSGIIKIEAKNDQTSFFVEIMYLDIQIDSLA